MRGSIVLAAVGVLILAVTARAQQEPTIPEGYIAYRRGSPTISWVRPPVRLVGAKARNVHLTGREGVITHDL